MNQQQQDKNNQKSEQESDKNEKNIKSEEESQEKTKSNVSDASLKMHDCDTSLTLVENKPAKTESLKFRLK